MSANKAPVTPPTQAAAAITKPEHKGPIDRRYYYAFSVGAAAAVVATLLSFLVIKPLVDKSLSTAKDLKYRTEEVTQLNTKLNNLKTLKQNYLALGQDTENKILVELPTDADEAHLTSLLSTVAGQTGVRLLSIGYSQAPTGVAAAPTTTAGGAQSATQTSINAQILPVSLSVNGSYQSITQFLTSLETAPRIMDVESVGISGSGNLNASVTLNAYYNPVTKK